MKWSLPKISLLVVMVAILVGVAVGVTLVLMSSSDAVEFPKEFKFGAATASYQIEGGWNEDGKSPSIWDTITQTRPGYIADNSTGNVAGDSYHMVDKDIEALENIGFEVYRFSIAWTRIIPDGSKVNTKGIEYYSNLIDKLLARNIEPLVTIFHWDLPQYIQDLGGWTNPLIVDYFRHYADVLFEHYGERVQRWITVNEPNVFCGEGYGYTTKAPAIASPGVGDYLCVHHVLLANAAVYHLYKEKYYAKQQGQVGICLNAGFGYPDEGVDPSLSDKAIEFDLGKYSNAIFSKEGGYPQIMIDEIDRKSEAEGRPWSRLPKFTEEQKKYVQGTADFLALNYYTSGLIRLRPEKPEIPISWFADTGLDGRPDPSWKRAKSEWLYSVPEGLRDLLKWIKNKYDNPTVMITENGWSDDGEIEDNDRVDYLKAHLSALAKAINDDGCNVVAYTVWSLIDNFEWKMGYTERFGIHYIDFDSDDKTRVPKKSAEFFKEFMKSKSFEYEEAKSSKKVMNPRMAYY